MTVTDRAMNQTETQGHFVQFYKADEPLLNRNVGNFLWDGLLRGDGLLVIATRQRRESLSSHLSRLGADVALARQEGQLAMLDARDVLARFMVNGQPDWDLFQAAIGDALQLARPRVANATISAYGEMVGVLWEAGETEAAIRLEDCWNRLLHCGGITLFCGYPIDVFANDFESGRLHDVLCAHSKILPTGANGDLRDALHQAMDERLGARADEVRVSMKAGIPSLGLALPEAESAILWLRRNVPEEAEGILAAARSHYDASHAPASA
jgi:MEDS: MEthanogen/methylotroph, DcmR Sensory domain